jgi:Icc-related predicted phosphoesterase
MKVLCTSDIHGDLSELLYNTIRDIRPGVLTISGDIAQTSYIQPRSDVGQFAWFEDEFIPFCSTFPDMKVVMTLGNHDYVNVEEIEDLLIEYGMDNRIFILINEMIIIDGVKFYGNPYSLNFNDWNYNTDEEGIYKACMNIPDDVNVFLTHQPALCTCDQIDEDYRKDNNLPANVHLGSMSMRDIIVEQQPEYVITGHIHTGSHRWKSLGDSKIINASILNEEYNSVYEPVLIEI